MPQKLELIGKKFGRWTVIGKLKEKSARGDIHWQCLCKCGVVKGVKAGSLRSGRSTSCGCYHKEITAKRISESPIGLTHGHRSSLTPVYISWQGMRKRVKSVETYIKKGVRVCNRWMKFENFLEDMGERPPGKTLDRIDNDGNYEPQNCRWATPKEQQRHRVGVKMPPRTWSTRPRCKECSRFHAKAKLCH